MVCRILLRAGDESPSMKSTLQTEPAGMTHWSCRTMAESQGIGKSTVSNIWRAHKLATSLLDR